MRIRSFIIAYALVLAILLFADRRPGVKQAEHYSHVIDLTAGQTTPHAAESATTIIAPGALIPGTWSAGQIPAERLVAPLAVLDLRSSENNRQISLDDVAAWETQHGMIPQGAVIAIRRLNAASKGANFEDSNSNYFNSNDFSLPIAHDAAQFLIDARYTIGFAVETPVSFSADRTLAQQLALHGSYVLARTARLTSLPATGSLIIVAPAKDKKPGEAPVRILAMVR